MINRNLKRSFSLLVVCIILVMISGTASANPNSPQANDIYVDTTEDHYEVVPDGDCSLREAITTINYGSAFGGCPEPAGATKISLAEGATYILSINGANEEDNETGDLDIMADMTIRGNNSTVTAWYLTDRVLNIYPGATVVINDLTIKDGSSVLGGGGILNWGNLTLEDSTVMENAVTPGGTGGGIYSYTLYGYSSASLTLHRSTILTNSGYNGAGISIGGGDFSCDESDIYSNNASHYGGGLFLLTAVGDYHARITRCAISMNTAGVGGGLYNTGQTLIEDSYIGVNSANSDGGNITNDQLDPSIPGGVLFIIRSVISGGTAISLGGGGVSNSSPAHVSIWFSTISGNNSFGEGGGVLNIGEVGSGSFTINHTTIVANTSSLPGSAIAMTSGGVNPLRIYIGNSIISGTSSALCNTWVDTASYGNLETTNSCNLNPSLGNYVDTPANFASYLKDNGSKFLIGFEQLPTETYALLPTSMAVDHADCELYTEDQRGYPLDVDGDGDGNPQCDMGSYELQIFSFIPMIKKP